jgi:hypothetical protein
MTPPQIVGLVILGLLVLAIVYVLLFAHTFSSNRSGGN